jgi:hypothetical protein
MSGPSNLDDPSDAEAMTQHAAALADALVAAIPGWVEQQVLGAAAECGIDADVARRQASVAAEAALADGEPRIRDLLGRDIDDQTSTPLAVLRSLVVHPNRALDRLGVAPRRRPEFDREAFPGDTHGLTPATFADVHPDLHEPGIVWGAAKAHIHLRRHKR